jgi:uncharacterized protein
MFYTILAGLGIGLFGSFHCIGMCGPIALALPVYGRSAVEKLWLIILYNLGRAFSYAGLGLVFGFAGQQFFLWGYQRFCSIALGLIILAVLFAGRYLPEQLPLVHAAQQQIKLSLARLLQSAQNGYSYFLTGILNGLLPCGLVYLAIGSAMATGNAFSGAALMFMFGLGTFPLMISLMIFGRFISITMRNKMRRMVPVFIAFTALLIIVRGLNLGIPYLSPELSADTRSFQQIKCHK